MKKITIAEYLEDIDTEELIEMISDTGSWNHVFDDICRSCNEDLDNSVFVSSLEGMKEYITNELTYFINDDEDDIDEMKDAISLLIQNIPSWLEVEIREYIEDARVALEEAIDENDRRMGFDI